MTTALSVLVLFGFGVVGPATALQFDTFSLSAVITGPSAATLFQTETRVTATAYPNVQFLTAFTGAHPANHSVLSCYNPVIFSSPALCYPGDQVLAGASSGSFLDTGGSLSAPGNSLGACDVVGLPQSFPGVSPRIGERCGNFSAQVTFAAVVLPPFTGTTEISVETVFSASAGASIREVDGPFSAHFVDGRHAAALGHECCGSRLGPVVPAP
jgi:hypothetical protein